MRADYVTLAGHDPQPRVGANDTEPVGQVGGDDHVPEKSGQRTAELSGAGAVVRDELTGTSHQVAARAVVNAAGVWAGGLVDDVHLRPSRGTHITIKHSELPLVGGAIATKIRELAGA